MWQYVFDLFKGGCCILRFSSPSFHWHWCDVIYIYSRQCVNKYTFDSLACMYIFIDIWLCICSRAHAYLYLRMVHVLRKCLLHIYIMIWIWCLPWPSASMPQSRTAQHQKGVLRWAARMRKRMPRNQQIISVIRPENKQGQCGFYATNEEDLIGWLLPAFVPIEEANRSEISTRMTSNEVAEEPFARQFRTTWGRKHTRSHANQPWC